MAKAEGLAIVAILETHPHADFASGHVELAQRIGAKIYVSSLATAIYDHVDVQDGDHIQVGDLDIEVLATPGHSPHSLSFVVNAAGEPVAVFTGDTLFVGDVGRPDLRDADETPEVLANALYDSLFGKLGTQNLQNVSGGMAAFEEAEAADSQASNLVFLAENI